VAIVFEMWAECATEDDCAALVAHFNGMRMTFLSGRSAAWEAHRSPEIPTGMVVWSRDLSRWGPRSLSDVLESTEAGIRLYHHLKSAPPFRFARVAWEAELIPLADVHESVTPLPDGTCSLNLISVLEESCYRQLGSPNGWSPFRAGYFWNRYGGEQYRPLFSSDQNALGDLCLSLFPDYFAK
jgi:hypothetical protein